MTQRCGRVLAPILLSALVLGACADSTSGSKTSAGRHDASVATTWLDQVYTIIQTERIPPMAAARIYGYASVALYEAVAPGSPSRQSLSGQLNGLTGVPAPPRLVSYDWPEVANRSIAGTLTALLAGRPAALAAVATLEASITSGRQAVTSADLYDRSADLGDAIGTAIAGWAAGDGLSTYNNCAYTPPTGPFLWAPTPAAFAKPLQPCWGKLRPFVLPSSDLCAIAPPNAGSAAPSSNFYGQMQEVYTVTSNLTDEQRTIALFWSDDPGTTGTPPGHWISLVGQYARAHQLSLDVAAEAYARVGIAVADAFISCWQAKYTYNTIRPVTYIQRHLNSAWLPLLGTPPFPDYPSGHSVQSGAATQVLTDFFGAVPFTDATHANRGFAPRDFSSWSEAADEAAISRLYGGIHYRDSIALGVEHGRCIGREISARVHFQR